jgi:hypothetical protein
MANWGDAFSFRRRVEVTSDERGKPEMILSEGLLKLVGVQPGDEMMFTVTPDGAVQLRKLPRF